MGPTFGKNHTIKLEAKDSGFSFDDGRVVFPRLFRHGGVAKIKALPYFKNIDWNKLLKQKLSSPYHPTVRDAGDASNFERFPNEDRKEDKWIPGTDEYGDVFTCF